VLLVETFPVGPLGCNCSIVVDPEAKTAVVIDPGGDFEVIRRAVARAGAKVVSILHTHMHLDHVGATAPLQAWSSAPARIHEADRFLYDMLPTQAALVGVPVPEVADLAGDLIDESTVNAGTFEVLVLHTPGHTPGSLCFVVDAPDGRVVFTGDTLFRRSVGRTDLWGGNAAALRASVRDRLMTLDEATRVVPGHGASTTIGEEKHRNVFVKGASPLRTSGR
jgi:glyoxylase-like metal-dependent hydrolase (beta-lactamase superfamily II)